MTYKLSSPARRALLGAAGAAALAALLPATAHAEGPYPDRPIKLIVPFPPGGGNDAIGRFIAQRLGETLKQSVIVENRGGAGGLIGVEAALKSPPDGYTLLVISPSYTINPSVFKVNFDPSNDFTAIGQISAGALVLVANPSVPAKTLGELVALAKAKPGTLTYASSGQGGIDQLATELFTSMAGIKLMHVPYKGGGPALMDTIAGQTQLFMSTLAGARPQLAANAVRALAVTTAKRIPALPDVPSIAESGYPRYDVTLWHGVIAPKGVPPEIVARLNAAINAIVSTPEAAQRLAVDGVAPAGGTPAAFQALIRQEIVQWHKVVAAQGIKAE
ncbi:MAG: tripartite tricarboxylate transporter substrate binding protein [Proteobacteria bacterium]|nr:tripartite tricarboxylate transporter substrate binding protein [Pseudomonadota bacterium]